MFFLLNSEVIKSFRYINGLDLIQTGSNMSTYITFNNQETTTSNSTSNKESKQEDEDDAHLPRVR